MQTLKSTSAVSPRKRRSPALLLENIAPDSATGISSSSVSPQKRRALQPLSSNSLLSLTSSTTVNPPVLCFKRTLQPVNFNKPQVVPGSNAISKPFCKSSQNVRQQSTSSHVNKTPGVMRSTSGHVIQIVRTSNTVISSSVSSQKRKALQPLSNNNLLSSPTSAVPVNQSVLDLQRNLQAVNFNKPSQNNVRQSTSSFVNKSSPCIAQSTSGHVTNQIVSRTSSVVQQPISSLVNITGPVITQSNDKSGHVTKIVVSRSQVVGQKSTSNPVNSAAITRSVPVSLKQSSRASVSIPKPDKHNLVVPSDDGDYHQTPPALPRNLLFYESSATAVLPQHDLNCGGSPNNTFQQGETRRSFPNTVQHSSPAILKFHKNVEEIISKDTLSPDCRVALKPARKSLSLKKTNVTTTSAAEQQGSDLSNKSLREDLMASLPSNYNYHIVSVNSVQYYHKQPDLDQSSMFSAIVRVNLKSKAEAEKWLDEFKESSFTDWRVRRTFPENTKCLIFKKGFRCNHNTLAQYRKTKTEAHKKHTECDAYICITVKNFNMNRSKDKLLEKFPCEISIEHCHNHPIVACDALRFRRPDKAIEELFKGMFRRGHSPSTALHTHQYDLQVANPTTFFEDLADGAKCPNLQWCYYQYRKMFKKEYGEPSGLAMLDALRSLVAKYNEDCGSVCAKVETFGSEVVLVLCSPLMKRVHEYLKASGEMTFLDSGGMMDRQNSRVFTFLAPSVAGALPVGMIITSSEAEDVLTFGMQELLTILPSCAFYGRGAQGPVVGMTDDSTAERNSLKSTFPDIILLLCLFHILSAFWRYVWESKHKVDPKDKEEIFFMFKHWCLTKSQEDFEKHYNELLADPRISGNKYLKKHIEDLSNRAPEWALWYRNNLLVRGNNTDNYSEAAIRRFKEDIMNRVRAYSLTQLFDFFTTRLEAYFERRIAAVLNNRQENYWKSKHFIKPSKLAPLKCFQRRDTMFEVHNTEKKTKYIVDIGLELCTCPVGFNGAPCKHQYAVVRDFNLSSTQFLPFEDVEAKAVLHKIMTTTAPKPGWYAPLKSGPTSHRNEVNDGDVDGAITLQCMAETNETASSSRESLNTPTETNEVAQKEALEALEAIYESLKKGLMEKPDVFTPAVQRFSELFHKAEGLSQNALLSAMHTFGNECVGMAYLQGRYIKVNKAGVIRRKYAAMAGSRKCAGQGRPRDAVRTGEHGYSKSKTTKAAAWDRFPPRSSALPHDLTERVQLSQRSKKK